MSTQEAEKIYRAIFGKTIPPRIAERFTRACELYSPDFSSSDTAESQRMAARHKDLEALEMAARWTKRLPVLVWKFQVMVRLGETLPENRSLLINSSDRRLRSLFGLCAAGLRSVWKLSKGLILLRRASHG